MALGEKRLRARHLHVRKPEKVAYRSVSLQRLNHARGSTSMGPEHSRLVFDDLLLDRRMHRSEERRKRLAGRRALTLTYPAVE